MFRFAISLLLLAPLLVMANQRAAVASFSWDTQRQGLPVQVQRYSFGGADYQHDIKRFSFASPITQHLSLSAQVVKSRTGLQDCASSFDQTTLGYEILPRLQVAKEMQLGIGFAQLDGGHMAFITGDRLDMADSQSFILSTQWLQEIPTATLELRLTRTSYDAHAIYEQHKAFTDNSLLVSYQLRF